MTTSLAVLDESASLPALVRRAASQLASATTAAEVLDARVMASVAYDVAKAAGRLAKAKQAHDDVIAAVYRAQADALEIESMAKRRLADEYDAAQERGEVAGQGKPGVNIPDEKVLPTVTEIGLTSKEVHEARQIRDAEEAEPGIVRRTLDDLIAAGEEPTKAEIVRAANRIKQQKRDEKRAERQARKSTVPAADSGELYELHHRDMREGVEFIQAESVHAIITDPPYGREHIELYEELAVLADHALIDGGSLVVMCGQVILPEILAVMTPHITYHWTMAYLLPGGNVQMYQKKVNNQWKPIIWFTKGKYEGDSLTDTVTSKRAAKDDHDWQQSESGIVVLVERFTDPGQVVLDPFLGSGTTGAVAVRMSRRFIGVENSEESYEISAQRLAGVLEAG